MRYIAHAQGSVYMSMLPLLGLPNDIGNRIMDYLVPQGFSYTTRDYGIVPCGSMLRSMWKMRLRANVVHGNEAVEELITQIESGGRIHAAKYVVCFMDSSNTRVMLAGDEHNVSSTTFYLFANNVRGPIIIQPGSDMEFDTGVSFAHFHFYNMLPIHDVRNILDKKVAISKMGTNEHRNVAVTLRNYTNSEVQLGVDEPIAAYVFREHHHGIYLPPERMYNENDQRSIVINCGDLTPHQKRMLRLCVGYNIQQSSVGLHSENDRDVALYAEHMYFGDYEDDERMFNWTFPYEIDDE